MIIGGSYFAGRVFVEELLRQGRRRISVFNRGNIPLPYREITQLKGDRERPELIRSAIPSKNWSAVIDFCAYTPEHIRSTIESLPGSFGHYIYISTTTIYAETTDLPVAESGPKVSAPQPELGPYADYGLNKWLAECELTRLSRERGFQYTILRPAIIYGRYNYAPRESYFFDLVENNRTIVIPETNLPLFSFLWVDDLAELLTKVMNQPSAFEEAFNVCAPELISYRRIVDVLERISGRKLSIQKMSPAEIDRRRIPLPFPLDQHLIYSSDRIRKAMSFQFTPFAEGMLKTWSSRVRTSQNLEKRQ